MRAKAVAIALLAALSAPAAASDYLLANRPEVVFPARRGEIVRMSPYPMSERAAAVWHSDACWKSCTGTAGWRLVSCLHTPGRDQDTCRAALDADDRACLRTCRTRGGPILNITD